MANVTIYSEDEVCVTTLKLLLKDSIESSSPGNRHSHSHKDFVDRILADVRAALDRTAQAPEARGPTSA